MHGSGVRTLEDISSIGVPIARAVPLMVDVGFTICNTFVVLSISWLRQHLTDFSDLCVQFVIQQRWVNVSSLEAL